MTNVSIIGIGKTNVREHWDTSIRHLAWYAIEAALDDAHISKVDALYVGNMLAGQLSNQNHLGALVADFSGLRGIEAVTVEAADASGGAAVRQAVLAVKSGLVETALVVGVEKITDETGTPVNAALATGLDADFEAVQGLTYAGAGALLMQRYMFEHSLEVAGQLAQSLHGGEVTHSPHVAKLTVSGIGLRSHTGVAIRMFRALSDAGINVEMVNTSEVQVNAVVEGSAGERGMECLSAAFADVLR